MIPGRNSKGRNPEKDCVLSSRSGKKACAEGQGVWWAGVRDEGLVRGHGAECAGDGPFVEGFRRTVT